MVAAADGVFELTLETTDRVTVTGAYTEALGAVDISATTGDTEVKTVGTDGSLRLVLPIIADVTWTIRVVEQNIPEGVREVIGHRLSRLSEPCNALLTTAAAMPGGFSFEVLAALSPDGDDAVLDQLEEALRAQVIREREGGRGAAYAFSHALIRQTLYQELSTPRQVRLHRQIGEALLGRIHARWSARTMLDAWAKDQRARTLIARCGHGAIPHAIPSVALPDQANAFDFSQVPHWDEIRREAEGHRADL